MRRCWPRSAPLTLWTDDGTNPLASAWNRLVLASRAMDAEAADEEYTALVRRRRQRSEIDLHASHWIANVRRDPPLVAVRADLAALGLGRRAGATTL